MLNILTERKKRLIKRLFVLARRFMYFFGAVFFFFFFALGERAFVLGSSPSIRQSFNV